MFADALGSVSDMMNPSEGEGAGTNYDFTFFERWVSAEFNIDAQFSTFENEDLMYTPRLNGEPGGFINMTASGYFSGLR